MDRLEVGIQMPLGLTETITGFSVLFYHDVSVSARAKALFDAVSHVSYDGANPVGSVSIDGDLLLRQTQTLYCKGGFQVPYSNSPLLSISPETSASDVSMRNILAASAARNLSLTFVPSYTYAERTFVQDSNDDKVLRFFNASIVMRVPVQPVRYNPPASEVFKWAWIQYIAFFAVVSFLLFRLNSFIFRHQVRLFDCMLFICTLLFVCPPVRLFVCLSVRLFVCSSVCLFGCTCCSYTNTSTSTPPFSLSPFFGMHLPTPAFY
jgi:hypothetical protein